MHMNILPPPEALIVPALWKLKFVASQLQGKFLRRNTAHCRKMAFMICTSGKTVSAWRSGGMEGPFPRVWYKKARYLTICGKHGLPGTLPSEDLRAGIPLTVSQPPRLHAAPCWQLQLKHFFSLHILSSDAGFSVLPCVATDASLCSEEHVWQVERAAWGKEQLLFQPEPSGSVRDRLEPWVPTLWESPERLKWQSWILVIHTSEWHWAVSSAVMARHLQEPGTRAHAYLVVVAHRSPLPTHPYIPWVSCAVLWLSLSEHGVMQIQLPSSARGFLFIFINSINHLSVIHSHWNQRV